MDIMNRRAGALLVVSILLCVGTLLHPAAMADDTALSISEEMLQIHINVLAGTIEWSVQWAGGTPPYRLTANALFHGRPTMATIVYKGEETQYAWDALMEGFPYGETYMNVRIRSADGQTVEITGAPFVRPTPKGYNPSAAVSYALEHAYDPPELSSGDCANFIAQCLEAGGIRFDADARMDAEARRRARAWVASQRAYLRDALHFEEIRRVSEDDIRIGDVIFYDWDGNGSADHVVICTSIQGGKPHVSGHTTAQRDERWNPNDVLCVIRLNDG